MTYEECIKKVEAQQEIPLDDFKGIWMFKMLADDHMRAIWHKKTLYEINFIPTTQTISGSMMFINETNCASYYDACHIMNDIISNTLLGNHILLELEGKNYFIEIEVLETPE